MKPSEIVRSIDGLGEQPMSVKLLHLANRAHELTTESGMHLRDGLDLKIEPAFKNREVLLVGNTDTLWEGPVRVSGTIGGRGFQELVGYAKEALKVCQAEWAVFN